MTGEIVEWDALLIDAALVSAQRRKRLFWTNIPNVTQPEDRGILLKDILEDDLDTAFDVYNDKFVEGNKAKTLGTNPQCRTAVANMGTGGNNVPYVPVALRNRGQGKQPEYNGTGKANALTTVQTDSMVARATVQKNAEQYGDGKSPCLTTAMGAGGGNVPLLMSLEQADKLKGVYIDGEARKNIRKLTVLECSRLQSLPDGYMDADVSNTQKYKSLGNAFCCDVVVHILKHLDLK